MVPFRARREEGDADITGRIRVVEQAKEGTRNATLFWASCRCAEHVREGRLSESEAYRWMMAAARYCGLTQSEADATIRSGLRS